MRRGLKGDIWSSCTIGIYCALPSTPHSIHFFLFCLIFSFFRVHRGGGPILADISTKSRIRVHSHLPTYTASKHPDFPSFAKQSQYSDQHESCINSFTFPRPPQPPPHSRRWNGDHLFPLIMHHRRSDRSRIDHFHSWTSYLPRCRSHHIQLASLWGWSGTSILHGNIRGYEWSDSRMRDGIESGSSWVYGG
jgi:hypothetical protein